MRSSPLTGYFVGSYCSSLDDSEQPFALWVPRSYSPRRKYPLIVALHGTDADERMIPEECFRMHKRGFREDVLFLSPFGRGDLWFQGPGEADFWEAIEWVKQRYKVDARRQYLTGLSMGGYACWRLACAYPDQWAAIAPICGGGDPARLAALGRMPVWCVHGEKDDAVPVEESRRLVEELKRLGGKIRYHELKDWRHNSWQWLYNPDRKGKNLIEWFLQFRRRAAASPISKPARQGNFYDLFTERVIISYPAQTPIPREASLLRSEAETWSRFTVGDRIMRSGKLIAKPDLELTRSELGRAHHLMLGRVENHQALRQSSRELAVKHVKGQLHIRGQTYLGKTLVALAWQPSPWNPAKLLAIITYQQSQQMRGTAERFLSAANELMPINLYDPHRRKFIRQEA